MHFPHLWSHHVHRATAAEVIYYKIVLINKVVEEKVMDNVHITDSAPRHSNGYLCARKS